MCYPKVTETGIPPLTTLSHCSRQFFSLESGVFCEKVYICCCWSTSGSLTMSWYPENDLEHCLIFGSKAVSFEISACWTVGEVRHNGYRWSHDPSSQRLEHVGVVLCSNHLTVFLFASKPYKRTDSTTAWKSRILKALLREDFQTLGKIH